MKTKDKDTEILTRTPMFGSRNTIREAFDYARMVMERSTDPSMIVYGTTALAVIWNTLSDSYEPLTRKEKENE